MRFEIKLIQANLWIFGNARRENRSNIVNGPSCLAIKMETRLKSPKNFISPQSPLRKEDSFIS